jgi:hypothetical protein
MFVDALQNDTLNNAPYLRRGALLIRGRFAASLDGVGTAGSANDQAVAPPTRSTNSPIRISPPSTTRAVTRPWPRAAP